jgi:predicted nucleotidyltransferase
LSRRGRNPASFARELEGALRGRPRDERKLLLVGVLNKHLPEGREAVLVGGALVEFYTSGGYVTGDVDIIGDRDAIVPLLEAAGFTKSARTWWNTDLELVVDIAGRDLRKTEDVVRVEFAGYSIPTVSLEDLIVDRLLAAKYWKSRTDWEQAMLLLRAHRSRVDPSALKRKAGRNDVGDWLPHLFKAIDAGGARPPPSK